MKVSTFKFEPFSKKQRQVLNWWLSPVADRDGIIADGAIRSGKTLCMSLSFVIWAMENFDEQNFGMCGKTIGSFRRNVLTLLKTTLRSRGYRWQEHRADNLLEITKNEVTNYFYIFGGKDERSQDLIQGITLAGVFFDEVALMPQSFVNQATARCSVDGSKYWFNCNPEGPYHWFYTDWIKADKDVVYLHFTMDDNNALSPKIKARYREQYSGVFYERYILGRWAMAQGVIYDMFDKQKHVVRFDDIKNELTEARYVSVDYGTQNATVFKLWQKLKDGARWVNVKEYYYSGRDEQKQKTDADYVRDMLDFIDRQQVRAVIVDPSAASFIEALRREGLPVIKAKNDVNDGIREVAKRLTLGELLYVDTCTHTFEEYSAYCWDERAQARGEDVPVKDHDHCMDADRYFVYTVLARSKAIITNKKKRGLH